MRLWISPAGDIIDLDAEDEPHSISVAKDPERFGLAAEPIRRHMEDVNQPGRDLDFDYDTLIVMAEMKGWVRVSRDARDGATAVSAANPAVARRALRKAEDLFNDMISLDLEIERIVGKTVVRSLHKLDTDQTSAFLRRGTITPARSYATDVYEPLLIEALEDTNNQSFGY